ncbi:mRNA 3' end processing factor [Hypoxylon texense]
MVLFDDEANGYRHHLLPLAHNEPIVEKAVCIASAFHLSSRQPRLRAPAEVVRDNLIRELSVASVVQPNLSESTWATLILLIVADLVAGHEDVSTLYDLLGAFLEARGPPEEPTTPLERFLYFQSCIIGFFTRPFSSLKCHSIGPQPVLGSPVSIFKQYVFDQQGSQKHDVLSYNEGKFAIHVPIYEQIFSHAVEIYATRMASTDWSVHLDHYMEECIRKLRALCKQLDLAAPGAHVVVWPIFVAAAESSSDDDRRYFTGILTRLWEKVGYANICRGLEVLPELWAQRNKISWVSALAEYKGLVIC